MAKLHTTHRKLVAQLPITSSTLLVVKCQGLHEKNTLQLKKKNFSK